MSSTQEKNIALARLQRGRLGYTISRDKNHNHCCSFSIRDARGHRYGIGVQISNNDAIQDPTETTTALAYYEQAVADAMARTVEFSDQDSEDLHQCFSDFSSQIFRDRVAIKSRM